MDAGESKVAQTIFINAFMLALASFASAVRVWVRGVYMKAFGLDDVLFAISWIFTFATCFIVAYMTKYGLGQHKDILTEEEVVTFLKLDFASEIVYLLAFYTIKISFLLFYLRIFPVRPLQITAYIVGTFVICQGIEEVFVVIFQCIPIQKLWNPTVEGKCLELLGFFYISFGLKLGTDLIIFFMPIPILYKTKLSRGKKIGVMAMFLLGLLVCVTSIIRATFLKNTSTDITWIVTDALNWSSIEVTVAVICSCIPSFRALISHRFPPIRRMLGLSTSGGPSSGAISSRRPGSRYGISSAHHNHKHIRLQEVHHSRSSRIETDVNTLSRDGSEEHIINDEDRGIKVTTNLTVTHVSP